jgi:hypothetical protein
MIVVSPSIASGGPSRVLVLRKWAKILIQMTGPGTVFIGTSKDEAGRLSNGETQDGIQLNSTLATLPFYIWWKGELWAAGAQDGTAWVIVVPGLSTNDFEVTGASECNPEFSFTGGDDED